MRAKAFLNSIMIFFFQAHCVWVTLKYIIIEMQVIWYISDAIYIWVFHIPVYCIRDCTFNNQTLIGWQGS